MMKLVVALILLLAATSAQASCRCCSNYTRDLLSLYHIHEPSRQTIPRYWPYQNKRQWDAGMRRLYPPNGVNKMGFFR